MVLLLAILVIPIYFLSTVKWGNFAQWGNFARFILFLLAIFPGTLYHAMTKFLEGHHSLNT